MEDGTPAYITPFRRQHTFRSFMMALDPLSLDRWKQSVHFSVLCELANTRNIFDLLPLWQVDWGTYFIDSLTRSSYCVNVLSTTIHCSFADNIRLINRLNFPSNEGLIQEPHWRFVAPALRCPYCSVFVPNVFVFASHVAETSRPFDSSRIRVPSQLCLNIQYILHFLEQRYPHTSIPLVLADTFASSAQVKRRAALPFAPVICPHCRCWLQHKWAVYWHSCCPEICYLTVSRYNRSSGRLPCTASPIEFRGVGLLASHCVQPQLRARFYWRVCIQATVQHLFLGLLNSLLLHSLWLSYTGSELPHTVSACIGQFLYVAKTRSSMEGKIRLSRWKRRISSLAYLRANFISTPFVDTD